MQKGVVLEEKVILILSTWEVGRAREREKKKKVKSFCPVTTIPAWAQNNPMCGF